MTDHQSTYQLDPATLERAAEAIEDHEDTGYDPEQIVDLFVRPALPVLVPAIREALVREMLAEFDERLWVQSDMPEDGWWEGYRTGLCDAKLVARGYLPADEGSAE